ncbi:MAG: PAS domain S-box protein [Armatimonadota bacterium]|nr:PAS domain S-box protein [bacterium]
MMDAQHPWAGTKPMDAKGRKRILMVGSTADSDEAKCLASAGYTVDAAASADEVLEKLSSTKYAKVLADSATMATLLLMSGYDKTIDALRESEEMYRNLVNRSNDGVVVLQDQLIKFVNPRFEQLSGYSSQTLLDTPFTDFLTPEEKAILYERYQRRMAGEYVPALYETTISRHGGKKIPLEISAAVVTFHGHPADLVLIRDITERKQAEDYLQRYRLLSETTRDMIIFTDLNGKILEVNRAAMEMFGYAHDEMLKMTVRDLRSEEERESVPEVLARAVNENLLYETIHRRRDGSTFPVEMSLSCAVIQGKQILVGIIRDISERKRIMANLDAERRRLRSVIDALPVAVIIADADGSILEANEQIEVIWGGAVLPVKNIEDYSQFIGWWPDTGEQITAQEWALARALIKRETVHGEMVQVQRYDGKRITILNSAAPIIDAEGHIIGGVNTQQDVTELVELREALERSLEEVKRESQRAYALESVAEAGLSITNLQDLLNVLVERISRALNVDGAIVFVRNQETGEFEAQAAYNAPEMIGYRLGGDEGLVGQVALTRQPVYIADAQHAPQICDCCRLQPEVKTILGVPLIARGRIVGVARLQSHVDRIFTDEEVKLMEAIGDRVAMAIDNAQLYDALQRSRGEVEEALERERHFSLLLQRALLPGKPSIGEGYSVAVRYVPVFIEREIGGDFYDIFAVANDCAGILVGDVSGKGLEAASLAATTRSTVHAFVHETTSAGKALSHTNSVLSGQQVSAESFVTVSLATLHLPTGKTCYSGAGHPPAIILRADGSTVFLSCTNLALGIVGELTYDEYEEQLNPGDKLVLYTDGISEARTDSKMLDLEGIQRTLSGHGDWSAEETAESLITAATQWADGKLKDDAAVVVVERLH